MDNRYPYDVTSPGSDQIQGSYGPSPLGVVMIEHRRRVIFEKQVVLELSKLPRWKPFITNWRDRE